MDDRRGYPKSRDGLRISPKAKDEMDGKYYTNKLPVSLDQIRNELMRPGNLAPDNSPTSFSPKTDSFSVTNSKQTDGASVPRPIRRLDPTSPKCASGGSENVIHLKQNSDFEKDHPKKYAECEFGDGQQYAEIIAELSTYYDLCARSRKRHVVRLEAAKFVMKSFEQGLNDARTQEEIRWKRTEELRANLETADGKFENFCVNATALQTLGMKQRDKALLILESDKAACQELSTNLESLREQIKNQKETLQIEEAKLKSNVETMTRSAWTKKAQKLKKDNSGIAEQVAQLQKEFPNYNSKAVQEEKQNELEKLSEQKEQIRLVVISLLEELGDGVP